ncbi:pyrophosphatase [Tanacetum coccineum]
MVLFASLCQILVSLVQDVSDSCRAATDVIFGLTLGYKSVIIPVIAIAIGIFVSFGFALMYVLIVAALGMVSTIATGLAIDAYGPVSDTVSGIAKRVGMSHHIRERTDTLDVAGNTIATIGKGFSCYRIRSPCNVNEEVKSLAKSVSKSKLGRSWTL